jgi:error-prone DNA polymerase
MGFYAPAQITQEVQRNGVKTLAADVTCSDWDCTLIPDPKHSAQPALRLGLRLVRGLKHTDADRILAERAQRAFESIDELAARAQLSRPAIQALAAAGALNALSAHRHDANWQALGVERLPGLMAGTSAREQQALLPVPTESEDILADYRHLGLTTGRHPLALLRSELVRKGFRSSADLQQLADGTRVRVGGLVTHMQQPATAPGVVFASLEDETGIVNIILWPKVFAAQRRCALESSLLVVEGTLQRRDLVAHVVAKRLHNASAWLGLARNSRDFH